MIPFARMDSEHLRSSVVSAKMGSCSFGHHAVKSDCSASPVCATIQPLASMETAIDAARIPGSVVEVGLAMGKHAVDTIRLVCKEAPIRFVILHARGLEERGK
jgi:hypothetical protein